MTHQEFADFTEQVFDRVRQIAVTKGKEYADDENNRFANFDVLAKDLEISPFKVWWCYVGKMLFAIKRWLRTGATLSESIEERFLDVIVYTLLAWGMARRAAEAAKPVEAPMGEGVGRFIKKGIEG